MKYFKHKTAEVQKGSKIGRGTKIWQNSQVLKGAEIRKDCVIGHNCFVGSGAKIGNGVKLESNIDVWDKVVLEDYVFVGPSAVFTNDKTPRAKYPKLKYPKYGKWIPTLIKEGATIGANVTIICGNIVGKWSMIGAGSVVANDIPDYGLVVGVPAKLIGFVCECGNKIKFNEQKSICKVCGRTYKKKKNKVIKIK